MDENQRTYYQKNIVAVNLTAALVKSDRLDDKDDETKWPCLATVSAEGSNTETSSTTSRDGTSNASNHITRKPFCTIGSNTDTSLHEKTPADNVHKDDIAELIEVVETSRPLWNFKLPITERSETVKRNLWNHIFSHFNGKYSIHGMQKTWKYLKEKYTREKKIGPSGSEGNKKEWPHLQSLSFLDEVLVNAKRTTESFMMAELVDEETEPPKSKKRNSFYIFSALVLFLVGSVTIVYTPFNILMNERLKMVRGLPAYEWWKNPPDEVLLRVYLFNVTNSVRFENGIDSKLELNEIGPIVFRELLRHSDVRFNDNGTMTYVATRSVVFLPEMTNIDLDAKLILPNFAALGMASYMWDASSFTKYGFKFMMKMLDTKMFINTSINDCLWNLTDPLVQKAKTMMPGLVPEENMGILYQIYNKFTDEVTVYMGPENGRRFFTVDKYNGKPNLGIWEDPKCDSLIGASEGVTYHQFVSKNDTLKYLRKTMCRVTPLKYKTEVARAGMTMYKFVLPHDVFAHPQSDPSLEDCYHNPKSTPLLSGLSDVSPCYYDFPIAASFPHFLNGDPALMNSISGLNPMEEKHGSFLIVEPLTGVPVESRARSQSNLVMHPTSGFSNIDIFSNMTIPMFWVEYNQVGLPWYITTLMYFTVNVLPYTQTIGSIFIMIAGLAMIGKSVFDALFGYKKPLYSYSSLDLLPSIN